MESNYYAKGLNAQSLYDVYETRHKRVKQYLNAEIDYVNKRLRGTERVLELGAGYGRIMKELSPNCKKIIGIDISGNNVSFGKEYLKGIENAELLMMDAKHLELGNIFDVVLCLQNGLSAMKVEPFSYVKGIMELIAEGGRFYISTYSSKFWEYRLLWFHEQADKGLLGEIDIENTKDGIIVCKDGFRAITHSREELIDIGEFAGFPYEIKEVDDSSIFLVISKV